MSVTFTKGTRFLFGPGTSASGPAMPPLRFQIRNLARDGARIVKSLAKGEALKVSTEVAGARMAICQSCELFNKDLERCSHPKCACFMRFKTWLKAMECPAGKWGSDESNK